MEDSKQRVKVLWNGIDRTFDSNTYYIQGKVYDVTAPGMRDFSWGFDKGKDGNLPATSPPEHLPIILWVFIIFVVILVKFCLCPILISKSRSFFSASDPAEPCHSSSGNRNILRNPLINSSEVTRIHILPSHVRTETSRNRTESHGRNGESTIGTAPASNYVNPAGNDRQYLSSNNLRVDQNAGPIGFDAGIDLERNSRGDLPSHTRPRMGDADFLPSDKPPPYSTVVSTDLLGYPDTFPSASLRNFVESPPPKYEERSIYNNQKCSKTNGCDS